jgi:hypothetical protein
MIKKGPFPPATLKVMPNGDFHIDNAVDLSTPQMVMIDPRKYLGRIAHNGSI